MQHLQHRVDKVLNAQGMPVQVCEAGAEAVMQHA